MTTTQTALAAELAEDLSRYIALSCLSAAFAPRVWNGASRTRIYFASAGYLEVRGHELLTYRVSRGREAIRSVLFEIAPEGTVIR